MQTSRVGLAGLISILGLVFAAAGCQNKLHDENLALHRQNRELQNQLNDTNTRLQIVRRDSDRVSALEGEIAAHDAKIAELQLQLRSRRRPPRVSRPRTATCSRASR